MRRGIGMLPTNRKENSVIPDTSVLENLYLAEHSLSARHQWINTKREIAQYENLRDALNIRTQGPGDRHYEPLRREPAEGLPRPVAEHDAEILLLDNPTQGVDVGAKEEIYSLDPEARHRRARPW